MFRSLATTTTLVLALSACGHSADAVEDVRPVRTQQISRAGVNNTSTYSGEIRARHEASLGFLVGGRIQRRMVEVGDHVAVGQPLFQIDPTDTALNANASRTQVESTRVQYIKAQNDYQRYAELGRSQFVSKSQVEQMRLAMETARESLRAAQATYGVTANQSSYTTLRASTSGVVTSITAEAGNVVAAGQVVVKIAERGEREVVISIPEARVDELRNARGLSVELWAMPGRSYTGRLRELAPDTDAVTRTYSARISIVNADDKIGLGMTGKLLVFLSGDERLRRLPLTSLYDLDGQPKVWVVDAKTSRVQLRNVVVAQAQRDTVLISRGLRDGELIVTAGTNLLHAGQKVRPVDASELPGARS
ncbi:efflux RND transporter periplasmic adaptor subunit [Lysobacter terrae]